MTRKWHHFTGSHLEVAVEARKLAYTVRFTFYKAVARRRNQSRDRKLRHVISGDRKYPGSDKIWLEVTWNWLWKAENSRILCVSLPSRLRLAELGTQVTGNDVRRPQVTGSDPEVTSFDRKSLGTGCRRPKSRVYCAFHFLQLRGVKAWVHLWWSYKHYYYMLPFEHMCVY